MNKNTLFRLLLHHFKHLEPIVHQGIGLVLILHRIGRCSVCHLNLNGAGQLALNLGAVHIRQCLLQLLGCLVRICQKQVLPCFNGTNGEHLFRVIYLTAGNGNVLNLKEHGQTQHRHNRYRQQHQTDHGQSPAHTAL